MPLVSKKNELTTDELTVGGVFVLPDLDEEETEEEEEDDDEEED